MLNFVFIIMLLIASTPAFADGKVEFIIHADPGFLEIEGEGGVVNGKALLGKDSMLSGTFTVDLRKMTTGIDLRDRHMKTKYLETDKFPWAVFILDPIFYEPGKKKKFAGMMTIHGTKKRVEGDAEFTTSQALIAMRLDMKAFGIQTPTYKLLSVGRDVEIKASINL
jgi:polyisoprenoid-binding protein YceI